jgi:hypothetical protein
MPCTRSPSGPSAFFTWASSTSVVGQTSGEVQLACVLGAGDVDALERSLWRGGGRIVAAALAAGEQQRRRTRQDQPTKVFSHGLR